MTIIKILPKQIPANWDEVKFSHFLAFHEVKDFADQLAIFTGFKPDTLRKCKIHNLEALIERMAFLNKPMPSIVPKSVLGQPIPKDLNFESVCQFEDAKEIVGKILPKVDGESPTRDQIALYADLVTIYAMPDYIDATPQQRADFAKKVLDLPCAEVMAIGNFTQLKLIELKAKELGIYRREAIQMRRFRLVLKSWRARLASWAHFALWKRKHHIEGMNS